LIEHFVANLFFRGSTLGLPLAAQRIDFDTLRCGLRRGQPANLGLRQYVARSAGQRDALLAALKSGAERLGFLHAGLEGSRRRSTRHYKQDGAKRVVISGHVRVFAVLGLQPAIDVLVAELEGALVFAADDLAPDQVGLDAGLERFRLDA